MIFPVTTLLLKMRYLSICARFLLMHVFCTSASLLYMVGLIDLSFLDCGLWETKDVLRCIALILACQFTLLIAYLQLNYSIKKSKPYGRVAHEQFNSSLK